VSFKDILIEKGDIERGFADADLVVEGEYRTGHQEHAYLETNGMLAVPENGGVTIHGSMQCPHYIHRALRILLDLPPTACASSTPRRAAGSGARKNTRR